MAKALSLRPPPWLRRSVSGLCLRRPGFDLRSVRVRFAVDEVAPVQVLLRVLLFPLSISFYQCSTLVTVYTSLLPEGKQTKSGNFIKMLLRKWESIGLKTASTLLRRVSNIAKSDYYLHHVCPYVRMEHLGSHCSDFYAV